MNNEAIELPTLREMQLGPYMRGPKCGCLMFHASEFDCAARLTDAEHSRFLRALHKRAGGPRAYMRLISDSAANTLANRRKALRVLEQAIEDMGYVIE